MIALEFILVPVLIALAYCFARQKATRDAELRFKTPSPRALRLFGKQAEGMQLDFDAPHPDRLVSDLPNSARLGPTRVGSSKPTWVAAGALDGVLFGATLHAATSQATPVYETLSRLSMEFDRTVALIPDWASDASEASLQGYENWIRGHVAESIAAHTLKETGHQVEFATSANQPGFDLLVDGVETQVKSGHSAIQAIQEHLREHPDIPVVTDAETATWFADPHVTGVADLDPSHVADVMHSADPGMLGGLDGFSIPVLTLGFSAFREARIAASHGFDPAEAVTNVASKSAAVLIGTGIGTAITASLVFFTGGAASPLIPYGSAAGGVVGAWVDSKRQKADAERKAEEFKLCAEAFQTKWDREYGRFEQVHRTIVNRWQAEYEHDVKPIKDHIAGKQSSYREELTGSLVSFGYETIRLLDRLNAGLRQDRATLDSLAPARSRFAEVVLPSWKDRYRHLGLAWIEQRKELLAREVQEISDSLARLELNGHSASAYRELTARIKSFVAAYDVADEEIGLAANKWISEAKRVMRLTDAALKEANAKAKPIQHRYLLKIEGELKEAWPYYSSPLKAALSDIEGKWAVVARAIARAGGQPGEPFKAHRSLISQLDGDRPESSRPPSGSAAYRLIPGKSR